MSKDRKSSRKSSSSGRAKSTGSKKAAGKGSGASRKTTSGHRRGRNQRSPRPSEPADPAATTPTPEPAAEPPTTPAPEPAGALRPKAPPSPPPPAYDHVPTLGEIDLHLFNEGTHRRIDELLGAHLCTLDGSSGATFATWAPNARRVSVVGDFCDWDGTRWPLRQLGDSGVFEGFVPGVEAGAVYKFEIEGPDGVVQLKTDPYGRCTEQPPGHASIVVPRDTYTWGDDAWMAGRAGKDYQREPVSIYEVHLGSWARVPDEGGRPLGYREAAPHLAEHVRELGFTHVELMPVMEHPFGGSWGYQVTGYFAPTSRYGGPDDLRFLIDTLHRAGIGVLLDWVPAHFPGDEHGLFRFDGTHLYEHEDPRQGKHPDWDTCIFNFGRREVGNFLLASALHWLREYHADGLRVDAVASMLFLDYSRGEGEWVPNPEGGRENLEALALIRQINAAVREEHPGALLVAEESTTWPGVTLPIEEGGLGFHLKWNMGWMHDTLDYFGEDPIHRKHHQDKLTFAMVYEHTEHFLMPLSHDEVVHGKGSLLAKMAGDEWQRLANLRALLTYMFTRPGKKLLFMGTELAPHEEWDHDRSMDWHLADDPARQGVGRLLTALGALYKEHACLWRGDPDPGGFRWIDCEDREQSVLIYERRSGDEHVVVVLSLTPVPRPHYRIGVPSAGSYRVLLSSDEAAFGGTGAGPTGPLATEPFGWHGCEQSLHVDLPPLAGLVLGPA